MVPLLIFILFTAIFVIFFHDFRGLIEKFFKIPGVKLFLPLSLFTAVILFNDETVTWVLLYVRIGLLRSIEWLAGMLPADEWGEYIAGVIVLTLLTLLPELFLDLWERKQVIKYYSNAQVVSVFIWIVASILFVQSIY